ncbi:hypothetical protein O181_036913 [Austropuccinia psidii MF-1]|uniref:Vacuolar protein sorting-associated protein 8 central domain-containing protein n=1 Tax=Austropuccinia psidii MF-1 TaxID=1389203 RepID=A0A9Q3H9M0_9BASI|nr:hypothetical protein [Austropuccinia psidii MF-1]
MINVSTSLSVASIEEENPTIENQEDEDEKEFRNLKDFMIEENKKTYEERFKDIFDQNSAESNLDQNANTSQIASDDEEFIYDGKDVALFEEDPKKDQEDDYHIKFNKILHSSSPSPSSANFNYSNSSSLDDQKISIERFRSNLLSPSPSISIHSNQALTSKSNLKSINSNNSLLDSNNSSTTNPSFNNFSKFRPINSNFQRLRSLNQFHSFNSNSIFSSSNQSTKSSILINSSNPKIFINSNSQSKSSSFDQVELDSKNSSNHNFFGWTSLNRISKKIYRNLKPNNNPNSASNSNFGLPTVTATSGLIVIGTSKGWVMVFDYASNLKFILGSESIVKEAGSVSSLSISHDHTFIAVGHNMGHIYLYNLLNPELPTRSVIPTTLKLVQDGRSEGHLLGHKIIHLGFIGARHTAIISADETGLAFYHTLGQVLGLISADAIRILGKYPDSISNLPKNLQNLNNNNYNYNNHIRQFSDVSVISSSRGMKPRKPTKIFGASPLPLGTTPHLTDGHGLIALITSTKLIVIGLKPKPRTWWKCMRNVSDSNQSGLIGSLCWFPSYSIQETLNVKSRSLQSKSKIITTNPNNIGMDPILAFSWGKTIRFITIMPDSIHGMSEDLMLQDGFLKGFKKKINGNLPNLRFVEGKSWICDDNVLAIQWLNWRIICVMTSTHFEIIDTQIWQRTGFEPIDLRWVVRLNLFRDSHSTIDSTPFDSASSASIDQNLAGSVMGSFKAYKGKIFLLTTHDLRLGMVISWADHILEKVQAGLLTEAIDLTTSYWYGRVDLETIGLPSQDEIRKAIVKPKLKQIMLASLNYAFSEQRMEDDTHFDLGGRGVDRTELFEGLVASCMRACLAIEDLEFMFEDVFERYQDHGIQNIFFIQLEPFVLRSEIRDLPTLVTQGLISLHEEKKEFDLIEQIIRHIDPTCLDINQVLAICLREGLYDALVYVYTEAMGDFVGPLVEFLNLIKTIHSYRQRMQQTCEGSNPGNDELICENTQKIEKLIPNAYKIFPYLSAVLSGSSYPNKAFYEPSKATIAKSSVYHFLFSGQSMHWPHPDGNLILTTEEEQQEPTYPYLRSLLIFDSEAMLDTLDVAFEDSWLHDSSNHKSIDRQFIIDLLIELISSSPEFTSIDRTFLHIFIARNLPKYSQFLSLSKPTLHAILISLATEEDRSTAQDRQLASEFLLSCYTPIEVENGQGELLQLFMEARFWRILRSIFTQKGMWADVIRCHLKDPDRNDEIFQDLAGIFRKIKRSRDEVMETKVMEILSESAMELSELSVPKTATLINKFRPQSHSVIIESLGAEKVKQFAYLRTLFEPDNDENLEEAGDDQLMRNFCVESFGLDPIYRLRYVDLVCEFDPSHVLRYLKKTLPSAEETPAIVKICKDHQIHAATVWLLDLVGKTRAAFDELALIFKSLTSRITQCLLSQIDIEINDTREHSSHEKKPVRSYVSQITELAQEATEICVKQPNFCQDGTTSEDCWFYLLKTIVECIQTCSGLLQPSLHPTLSCRKYSPTVASSAKPELLTLQDHNSLEDREETKNEVVESLRGLLPKIVSALISGTKSSNQVSFSKLVKRLIESPDPSQAVSFNSKSNQRIGGTDSQNLTSEFRCIILMLMDTYRFEGNVLEVTGRLIDQDLFKYVNELVKAQEKGFRPDGLSCHHCQRSILLRESLGSWTSANKLGREETERKGGEEESRGKLIQRLGLPVQAMRPIRKQSLKGKEVAQSVEEFGQSSIPYQPDSRTSNGFSEEMLNPRTISEHQLLSRPFTLAPAPRPLSIASNGSTVRLNSTKFSSISNQKVNELDHSINQTSSESETEAESCSEDRSSRDTSQFSHSDEDSSFLKTRFVEQKGRKSLKENTRNEKEQGRTSKYENDENVKFHLNEKELIKTSSSLSLKEKINGHEALVKINSKRKKKYFNNIKDDYQYQNQILLRNDGKCFHLICWEEFNQLD